MYWMQYPFYFDLGIDDKALDTVASRASYVCFYEPVSLHRVLSLTIWDKFEDPLFIRPASHDTDVCTMDRARKRSRVNLGEYTVDTEARDRGYLETAKHCV